MWKGAALMLATRPISQAEFEGILARLERSCRTFSLGIVSRNDLASLHETPERSIAGQVEFWARLGQAIEPLLQDTRRWLCAEMPSHDGQSARCDR